MAVALDQQHHGGLFKPIVAGQRQRQPLIRCRLQSYSHSHSHGLNKNMLEFSLQTTSLMMTNEAPPFDFHRRSFSTPCLSLATTNKMDDGDDEEEEEPLLAAAAANLTTKIEIIYGNGAPKVHALIVKVAIAMASGGIKLVPTSSGLGGAYFLQARNINGNAIAVVKPIDEEPLALNNNNNHNNSKGFVAHMKPSIRVGETGLRELAAYLLDHAAFAGVPPTALVKISHQALFHENDDNNNNNNSTNSSTTVPPPPSPYKIASLQHYVNHDSDAGDLGPSSFSVASVHRIGILDVRLLNLDRHSGNILVIKKQCHVGAAELVPVDHGLCLPETLDDPYFEWLHWPQASVPFSDFEIDYISRLDPFKDAQLLRTELPGLRESSIRILVLCTFFLKQAVAAGLCLADIGDMMTREFCGGSENFSVLENLCVTAKISVMDTSSINGEEEEEEETQVFQFDDECDQDNNNYDNETPLNLTRFLESTHVIDNVATIDCRIKSARSMTGLPDAALSLLHVEEDDDDDDVDYKCKCDKNNTKNNDGKNENGHDNENKVGAFMKSMSFSVRNYNHENGGISFGEMSEQEWDLFMESFEKLLPGVFEEAKNMGLSKQRLGSSCEF